MKNLYNENGTLLPKVQELLLLKPSSVSVKEWNVLLELFKKTLTQEELKEFQRLKSNERSKRWRQNNPDKVRESNAANYNPHKAAEWRQNNTEKIKHYSKKQYWSNRDELLTKSRNWSKENRDKSSAISKRWATNNPESASQSRARSRTRIKNDPELAAHYREYARVWHLKKRKTDPLYRLLGSLRSRCNQLFRSLAIGERPSQSKIEMCGCSPEYLKTYFESLFTEGMSWDNYGEWVVDHIRPICSFTAEDYKQANHYTNLRPLWLMDNAFKSSSDKQQSRYKQ
jgi:hypothetical protein